MADDGTKDDNMTPEEREKWLRGHGIQIETVEDRERARQHRLCNVDSILQQMTHLDQIQAEEQEEGSVKFVCVPHDDSRPMRTLTLPASLAQGGGGDALPDFVKPHFADSKAIDSALLQQQATKHFAGGDLKGLAENKISASAMNAVAAQGSVETFPLVHPTGTNDHTGVYVYLDEVGLLKKLPNNARASAIAGACGFDPPPSFYGDVFLGRVKTRPLLHNVDFVAGADTDRGADWIRRAVSENLEWQQEMNKVTGREGETQPSAVGTDGTVESEKGYTWTQDGDEIEISVPFGSAIDKGSVKVAFHNRAVTVKYENSERLSVKLYGAIDVDGCTWTIDGENLVITCEKADGGAMWPRVQESS